MIFNIISENHMNVYPLIYALIPHNLNVSTIIEQFKQRKRKLMGQFST